MHATGSVSGIDNFATVGRFTYDGKGSLTGKLFIRMNGANVELTLTGTYSVSSDCTFSDIWNLSNGSVSTHEAVIVDEGKGYFIVATTEDGAVRSGEAKKQ